MREPQVRLQPGDVIVFPQGDPHFMSSAEGVIVDKGAYRVSPGRHPETQFLGPEGGRDTSFVCGFLGCDARPFNPLLASLPRRIHVPGIANGWLAQFPQQVVAESRFGGVGSETMLTRMADSCSSVVLATMSSNCAQRTGWLSGLRDPGWCGADGHQRLGIVVVRTGTDHCRIFPFWPALLAAHGRSPMLYLTRWRLRLAAEQLQRSSASGRDWCAGGLRFEAAFSRLSSEARLSPAEWRRSRQVDLNRRRC
jgi:hypothetical protein